MGVMTRTVVLLFVESQTYLSLICMTKTQNPLQSSQYCTLINGSNKGGVGLIEHPLIV